jgi:MYXO-CTERM domain-containing protein
MSTPSRRSLFLTTTAAVVLGLAGTAAAHFKLNSPAASLAQDNVGNPQKAAPCGGAGTPTNMVTAVQSGSMLSVSITETIFHPGHYRVVLAPTVADLPPAPTVNDAQCNGLQPLASPAMPILADGLLPHTAAFPVETQTMQVPIPAGMTCQNCVLQVIQYMAQHAQPCFYYHCAIVNVSPNAPPPPPMGDAGVEPDAEGGGASTSTGGCSVGGGSATSALAALALGAVLLRRRRRA